MGLNVFKSKDTAHTTGAGTNVRILIEWAAIQVVVIVVTAARRTWPYIVRVAVVIAGARAAAAQIPAL